MNPQRLVSVSMKVMETILSHPLENEKREIKKEHELLHIGGTITIARILAKKRGANEEEAAIMSALHDLGRILTGKQEDHAKAGYEPAKKLLKETGFFSDEETERIAKGVLNHSNKEETGSPEEEIIKDSDILDYSMSGFPVSKASHVARLKKVSEEFEI